MHAGLIRLAATAISTPHVARFEQSRATEIPETRLGKGGRKLHRWASSILVEVRSATAERAEIAALSDPRKSGGYHRNPSPPARAQCQQDASARVNQNSWPVDKTRTMPCPLRVQSAKVWADPPLASRAGARAFNTERSTSCGVKLFGSLLVFPLLVFLVFVFIGESSITYGVLKRRNPLG